MNKCPNFQKIDRTISKDILKAWMKKCQDYLEVKGMIQVYEFLYLVTNTIPRQSYVQLPTLWLMSFVGFPPPSNTKWYAPPSRLRKGHSWLQSFQAQTKAWRGARFKLKTHFLIYFFFCWTCDKLEKIPKYQIDIDRSNKVSKAPNTQNEGGGETLLGQQNLSPFLKTNAISD